MTAGYAFANPPDELRLAREELIIDEDPALVVDDQKLQPPSQDSVAVGGEHLPMERHDVVQTAGAGRRAKSVAVLRQQIETRADPVIQGLHAEISAYPVPPNSEPPGGLEASRRLATPLRIATRLGTVSFLNTVTVFGTPNDVTLAELALEMLFPADAETIEITKSMVQEQPSLNNTPGGNGSLIRDLVA